MHYSHRERGRQIWVRLRDRGREGEREGERELPPRHLPSCSTDACLFREKDALSYLSPQPIRARDLPPAEIVSANLMPVTYHWSPFKMSLLSTRPRLRSIVQSKVFHWPLAHTAWRRTFSTTSAPPRRRIDDSCLMSLIGLQGKVTVTPPNSSLKGRTISHDRR